MKITFIHCPELVVYNDMGKKDGQYVNTGISSCECKARLEERQCISKGKCIVARDHETWSFINKDSFKKGK